MKLPDGYLADALNKKTAARHRSNMEGADLPRLHVSDLIRSTTEYQFCPRQHVLSFMERRTTKRGDTTPKFQLLYDTGHWLGEMVVNRFRATSLEFGNRVWGDWTCACEKTTVYKCIEPEHMVCNHCSTKVDKYLETDILIEELNLVGHADFFIMDEDGWLTIVEVKSINRSDVDFETMRRPLGDHVMQVSFYWHMMRQLGYKVRRNVRVLYIDRSMTDLYTGKPYKEFSVPALSSDRVQFIVDRALEVKHAVQTLKLPDRICDGSKCSRAKRCNSAVSCFGRKSKKIKRLQSASTSRSQVQGSTSSTSKTPKISTTSRKRRLRKPRRNA